MIDKFDDKIYRWFDEFREMKSHWNRKIDKY